MQREHGLRAQGAEAPAASLKGDPIGPLILAAGGGLTIAWLGVLSWGALSLATYVSN